MFLTQARADQSGAEGRACKPDARMTALRKNSYSMGIVLKCKAQCLYLFETAQGVLECGGFQNWEYLFGVIIHKGIYLGVYLRVPHFRKPPCELAACVA